MNISFLYYSIIVINALIFLVGRKNRLISIPSAIFLILFLMGKRFADNFIAYDLRNFANTYDNLENYSTLEIGYKFINQVANEFNLPFESFYMILVASIVLLFLISVKKIGGNLHIFIMSYMIYYVLVTMDQLRNQSALALFMFLLFPLFYYKNRILQKRGLWYVFICLAVASMFHVSFLLYIVPLYLCCKKEDSFLMKWMIVMVLLYFTMMITSSNDLLKPFLISMIDNSDYAQDKYGGYLENRTSLSSFASLIIYLVLLFSVYRLKMKNKISSDFSNEFSVKIIDSYYKFVLAASFFLPFLLIDAVYYRYIRDVTFIGIAYLGINSVSFQTNFLRRLETLSYTLAISIGWFVFDIVIKGYTYDYIMFFFDNEIIKI